MSAQVRLPPGLSKQKSKLRLRLGLGGDVLPKSARPFDAEESLSVVSATSHEASSASSHLTTTSPNAPTESLGASTNTTRSDFSRFSRGDSRSAFGLEISPSTASAESPSIVGVAIDTISYTTSSPRSSAFDSRFDSRSTLLLDNGNPSDRSTASPLSLSRSNQFLPDRFAKEYKNEEALEDPEDDEREDERDLIVVNRMQRSLGIDDIFLMTSQQLFDSFHFIKEVGYGNWGSVWQCVPRHTGSVRMGNVPLHLGKKAAAFGGYGAGGRVAVKLVHRRNSKVSNAFYKLRRNLADL
jgi:protein-serine/threonine kinase